MAVFATVCQMTHEFDHGNCRFVKPSPNAFLGTRGAFVTSSVFLGTWRQSTHSNGHGHQVMYLLHRPDFPLASLQPARCTRRIHVHYLALLV